MAGRGGLPKELDRKVRRDPRDKNIRVVEVVPSAQPDLPEFDVAVSSKDGESWMEPFRWPDATRGWWRMWGDHPLSEDFTDLEWQYLLDTALIHAAAWSGDLKAMPELRLRCAKFGVTPEDRARLRIQFATADMAESGARARQPTVRPPGLRLAE